MIIYRVEITLETGTETEWLDWMQQVHVPDVLRTGCFTECHIYKKLDSSASETIYVMQYRCPSLQDYEHYRETFAPVLQKEHSDRFAGPFRGSRQLLEEIDRVQPEAARND